MNYIKSLKKAKENRCAIGAFNIFNDVSIRAAIAAAETLNESIILQTSVKTVEFYGAEYLSGLIRNSASHSTVSVYLHLDHCRNFDVAEKCINAGWDSIMYDGSALPLEENIKKTKYIVALAHKKGIAVEGELGKIGGVEEDIIVDSNSTSLTSYNESLRFVAETGIDAFAPAIGTAHGIYKGTPHIDFSLVERLSQKITQPIVIHGGTGLSENTFRKLIQLGGCKVNVSTALKIAYADALKTYFECEAFSNEPLKIDSFSFEKLKEVIRYHISLFGQKGKNKW